MRFNQDSSSHAHVVRAYRQGELEIDDETHRTTVIVSASTLESAPQIRGVEDLSDAEAMRALIARMLALEPELALIGTGASQVFPATGFRAQFLSAGVGVEVMDTGAACRTFNVLAAERRRVVALLMV